MKYTIEFDSETKQLTVKEGDSVMSDVDSLSIYKDCYCEDDKPAYRLSISQAGKKEGGVRKSVYTTAQLSIAKLLGANDEN